MKIQITKLLKEDFNDAPNWITKLLSPLNSFFSDIQSGLNNNLSVVDNLHQEFKEITFVNSTSNFPLRFNTKFNKMPKAVYVAYCFDETSSTMNFTQSVWVNWSFVNNQLVISNIIGLPTSGNKYFLRLHLIYS